MSELEQYKGMWVRPGNANDQHIIDVINVRDDYKVTRWAGDLKKPGPGADKKDGLCIDLGSHIGSFACLWRGLVPTARVVCVEQDATHIPLLQKNVGDFATVIHGVCTYLPWRPPEGRRKLTVEDILHETGERYVEMLKIDVEGFEWDILARIEDDTLERTRTIVGEYHGSDEPRFKELCRRRMPNWLYEADAALSHFTLYNFFYWWRKECGA